MFLEKYLYRLDKNNYIIVVTTYFNGRVDEIERKILSSKMSINNKKLHSKY